MRKKWEASVLVWIPPKTEPETRIWEQVVCLEGDRSYQYGELLWTMAMWIWHDLGSKGHTRCMDELFLLFETSLLIYCVSSDTLRSSSRALLIRSLATFANSC